MGRKTRVERALRIPGRLGRERRVAVDERDAPAPGGETRCGRRPGKPCADYDRFAFRGLRSRASEPGGAPGCAGAPPQHAAQHFPLATESRGLLDGKPGGLQPTADLAGDGVGRAGCARRRQARDLDEHVRSPHLGVLRRREPVEEPRVHAPVQPRENRAHVAGEQGEQHAAAAEHEPVPPGCDLAPLREQLTAIATELAPHPERARDVGRGERMAFDADVAQPRRRRGSLVPEGPRGGEVEAGAEPGFADRETAVRREGGPALAQAVPLEEDVASLLQTRIAREVDVAEAAGYRLAVLPVDERGRCVGNGRHGRGRNDTRTPP